MERDTAAEAPNVGVVEAASNEVPEGSFVRRLEIRVSGNAVGGVSTTLSPTPEGGLRSEERMRLTLERRNAGEVDRFETESQSVTTYGPGYVVRHERTVKTDAGVSETTEVRYEADQLVFRFEGPARSQERTFEIPPDYRSSLGVLHELMDRASAGETLPLEATYASFDSSDERFETRKVELLEVIEDHPLPGGGTTVAYVIRDTDQDGKQTDSTIDANCLTLEMSMFGGTFTAVAVAGDPFEVDHYAQITSEIPVQGAVDEWWNLQRLELDVHVEGDDPKRPPIFENNLYQQVRREGDHYLLQLTSTRPPAEFAAPRLPMKPPEDVARYLASTPMSQSDDPKIMELAGRLAAGSHDTKRIANAITMFVYETLEKRSGARGAATATEVLEERAGDCTEHAALTVALLRAAGLPARNVGGIVYLTDADGNAVAGYHAWSEVWIGQWIGVDAMFAEVGTSARYLMTGYNEPGEKGDDGVGRTLGRTKLKVKSYQRFGETTATIP